MRQENTTMGASDHIYIHVPFCDGKCGYCVFYSESFDPGKADRYLDAVARELDELPAGAAPSTIYFGGGTPSILDSTRLERLCRSLLGGVSADKLVEWTLEANPGTLPPDKLAMLREAGVNRISLGAQSFEDAVLRRIGRRHDAAAIGRTLAEVREAGIGNVGLDLIACLPGVDDDGWRGTLAAAAELEPDHISVYALSVEPGSAFSRTGVMGLADDAALAALETAEQVLGAAGYGRYEISNYSKPGRECAHNLSCWRGEDYLGFGPAASSRAGHRRWTNLPAAEEYCRALAGGEAPPREGEELTARADATERLMFAFRLTEGVSSAQLQHTDVELAEHWRAALDRLGGDGLVELREGTWLLTQRGRALADYVAGELIP